MGNVFGGMMGQTMTGSAPANAGPGAPPPIPNSTPPFFIAVNNQQTGPFEFGLLAGKVRSGELTRESLVWKQGLANWVPAKDVPELAALLGAMPPPLPR
jgi:hypothetical protein